MPNFQQGDEQISDGVNLLISILVRYPEIGTINYNPHRNLLKLTFLLSEIPSQTEFALLRNLVLDSIDVYHRLEGVKITCAEVELSTFDQVAMLNIIRDVSTLSKGEIGLVIAMLRDKCKEHLVIDFNDSLPEEDLLVQEELIENMLENMKQQKVENSLIGIREDGRVLVFNK